MEDQEQSNTTNVTEDELPTKIPDARDELNLAEFPLCCIADRVQPGRKTLTFEDRIWDAHRGEMIPRQLTITASDAYGLPTAMDDEVLLGLIQLSKLQDFSDRRVQFTRYQLIRLLGWRDESKSYDRLERSLNRWVGVTLYYQNAWRDRTEKSWVDEKFHVLDNVTLYDRDKPRHQTVLPLSSFLWNDVIFRSFRAGNLKGIDFDLFKSLESAIAKRLYRFLDKRFFHRDHLEFHLKEMAWEHIGLARSYDTANLKRRLRPAIAELEQCGFLLPMADTARFRKVTGGDWRIFFELQRSSRKQITVATSLSEEATLLSDQLIQRGVTPSSAAQVVADFPLTQIRTQLEVFDWLKAQNDRRLSLNPAGFLISSIKSAYAAPQGFVSHEERERRAKLAAIRKEREEARRIAMQEQEQKRLSDRDEAIHQFWTLLSEEERSRIEGEAILEASSFDRGLIAKGGTLGRAARKRILDAAALRTLEAGP